MSYFYESTLKHAISDLKAYPANSKKLKQGVSNGEQNTIEGICRGASFVFNSNKQPIENLLAARLIKECMDLLSPAFIQEFKAQLLETYFRIASFKPGNAEAGGEIFGPNPPANVKKVGISFFRMILESIFVWKHWFIEDIEIQTIYFELTNLGVKFPSTLNYFKNVSLEPKVLSGSKENGVASKYGSLLSEMQGQRDFIASVLLNSNEDTLEQETLDMGVQMLQKSLNTLASEKGMEEILMSGDEEFTNKIFSEQDFATEFIDVFNKYKEKKISFQEMVANLNRFLVHVTPGETPGQHEEPTKKEEEKEEIKFSVPREERCEIVINEDYISSIPKRAEEEELKLFDEIHSFLVFQYENGAVLEIEQGIMALHEALLKYENHVLSLTCLPRILNFISDFNSNEQLPYNFRKQIREFFMFWTIMKVGSDYHEFLKIYKSMLDSGVEFPDSFIYFPMEKLALNKVNRFLTKLVGEYLDNPNSPMLEEEMKFALSLKSVLSQSEGLELIKATEDWIYMVKNRENLKKNSFEYNSRILELYSIAYVFLETEVPEIYENNFHAFHLNDFFKHFHAKLNDVDPGFRLNMLINKKIIDPAIRASSKEGKRVQGELLFVLKKYNISGLDILNDNGGPNSSFVSMHSSSSEKMKLSSGTFTPQNFRSKAEIIFSADDESLLLRENEKIRAKIKEVERETYLLKCENFKLKKRLDTTKTK